MTRKDIYESYLNGYLKLTLDEEYLNKWISLEEFKILMNNKNIINGRYEHIGKRAFTQILKSSGYQIKIKRKRNKDGKITYYYITK